MSYVRCLSLILCLLFCLRANGNDVPGFYVSKTGLVTNNLVFTVETGDVFEPQRKNISGRLCVSLADFFSTSGIKFSNFNHKGPIGLRFSLFIPSEVPDAEFPFYYYSSYALKGKSLGVLSTAGLERSRWVTATVWLPSFQVMETGEALFFDSEEHGETFYHEYRNSFSDNQPVTDYALIEEERKAYLVNGSQNFASGVFVNSVDVRFSEPLSELEYQKRIRNFSTLPGEDFLLKFFFVLLASMLFLPFFLMRRYLSMKILLILFLPVLPLIFILCLRANEFFGSLAANVSQNILEEQQQDFVRLQHFISQAEIEEEAYRVMLKDQNETGGIEFALRNQFFREEWERAVKDYEKDPEGKKEPLVELAAGAVSRFEPHKDRFYNYLPIYVSRSFDPYSPPLPTSGDWEGFKDYIYSCSRNGGDIAALIQEIYWKFLLRLCVHDKRFLIENNFSGLVSRSFHATPLMK
jgi:hypothetical protein